MRPYKSNSLIRLCLSLLTSTFLFISAHAQNNETADVTSYITTLTSERVKAEDRVKQIKQRMGTLPATEVAEARRRYNDGPLAKFAAFREYGAFTIRQGKKPTKTEIQNQISTAVALNKDFCDFADKLLLRPAGGNFVAELIAIGEQLFKLFRKVKAENRESSAKGFENATVWRTWDQIT